MSTVAQHPPPCRKCRSTERTIAQQTFKDGTVHSRVTCAGCGKFIRYAPRGEQTPPRNVIPLPTITPAKTATPATPAPERPSPTPIGAKLHQAVEALDRLRDRANELIRATSWPTAEARVLALYAAAQAAEATLSTENLESLEAAIRSGKLPRQKGGVRP
jgi:hypothetical protein